MPPRWIFLLLAPAMVPFPAAAGEPAPSAQGVEFFEKRVRPVLATKCQSCHGPEKQRGGLRLDSRAGLLQGSENGPVIQAGTVEKSPLLQVLRHTGEVKMPPREKLEDQTIADLEAWIKMGAPWPGKAEPADSGKSVAEVRRRHWSFKPVHLPALPAVRNSKWVRTPVDAFVLAQLEAKGLNPAPEAGRETVVRRLFLDLLGLPPSPEEVQAFLTDQSPDAYEKLVDHLLSSPRYGERWARHWLDVARYADTRGYVFTEERHFPFSYTYRDYVIRAFNEDLPYDQFILHQLAADQLPLGKDKRPLAAMGFLTLGRRFLNNIHDIIDDRMDVTMRGLQGLTVACARCHDHKFDPIPQKDYYSLYSVFASSLEPKELPAISMPEASPALAAFEKELAKRRAAVEKFRTEHKKELAQRNRLFRDQLTALQKKVDEWQATAPGAPPRAMILKDAPTPTNTYVFLRGNPNNHGPSVPRQLPEVLTGDRRQPFTKGSGRLELAQAIASKDNPLTARVLVNRLWLHHFGAGLVRTPSDFGLRGEASTHPELLDWLAATFMKEGWSIKKMHRVLLLSSTYRQSSDNPSLAAGDPENRLLGRMSRQRLDFEALRDTLLSVAGQLDTRMGGRSVDLTTAPFTARRSVYGYIDRQNLPGLFRTFDFASPDASTPQRYTTTVPQQALFLMNSPFVVEQARHFAARPDVAGQPSADRRIQRMHWLAYGRPADPDEVALGLRFVAAAESRNGAASRLMPWEQYAQVLLLSNELAFVD